MKKKILTIATIFALLTASVAYAHSLKYETDTICHKNGSTYEKTVTSPHDFKDHFNKDGTPKEGHSEDMLLEGEQSCPTGGGGGDNNGGTSCTMPVTPSNLVVDTKVLNDHAVTLTWGDTATGTIEIRYGWDENNLNLSTTTANDGEYDVTGLTNGVHYWFQVLATNNCGSSAPSIKIDPLP